MHLQSSPADDAQTETKQFVTARVANLPSPPASRFTVLDSWRGVCALMVALYHLPVDADLLQMRIVRHAHFFVDFFFVLSGFVIAHAYASRIVDAASAATFLIRRWGRIWPLHLALLLFLLLLEGAKLAAGQVGLWNGGAFQGGNDWYSALTALFLVQAWNLHSGVYWNYPSWSISAEWAAYILFAAITLTARRHYLAVAMGIGFACAVAGIWLSPGELGATFDSGVLRCVTSFSLGLLAQRIVQRYSSAWLGGTALEIGVLILVVVGIIYFTGPASHLLPLIFFVAVIIFAHASGALSQMLDHRFFHMLGDLSYSIYMNHAVLIMLIKMAAAIGIGLFGASLVKIVGTRLVFADPFLALVAIIAYLAILVWLSGLTYRHIELPAQALFGTWARRIGPSHITA